MCCELPFGGPNCQELLANCRLNCRFVVRIANKFGVQIDMLGWQVVGRLAMLGSKLSARTSLTKLGWAVPKIRLDQDGLSCGKDQAGRGWNRLEQRPSWTRHGLIVTQRGLGLWLQETCSASLRGEGWISGCRPLIRSATSMPLAPRPDAVGQFLLICLEWDSLPAHTHTYVEESLSLRGSLWISIALDSPSFSPPPIHAVISPSASHPLPFPLPLRLPPNAL